MNFSDVFVRDLYSYVQNTYVKTISVSGYEINYKENPDIYDEILDIIEVYLSKINNTPARYVKKVIEDKEKLVFLLVFSDASPFANYCFNNMDPVSLQPEFNIIIPIGRILRKEDIEKGIKSNREELVSELLKKVKDFISYNIEDIVYSLYQEIVRYNLIVDINRVKYDEELLKLSSLALAALIIKLFGKKFAGTLTQTQVKVTNIVCAYFILTFFLKFKPNDALDIAKKTFKEYTDAVEFIEKSNVDFSHYKELKDLGTLLSELGIIDAPSMKFTITLSNNLSPKVVIDMFTSYPSLISYFIVAKYPVSYINKKMIVGDLNDKLEEYVVRRYM